MQIVYARVNYAYNQAQKTTAQREYVTKSDVGLVIDAYRKARIKGVAPNYNPANSATYTQAVTAVQNQLGLYALVKDKTAAILKQFYYGVFGNPQQIGPGWFTAGTSFKEMTESQRDALAANAKSAAAAQADAAEAGKQAEDCGIFCTIKNSFKNLLALPGNLASGVGTTASIMSVAVPVVIVGGTVWGLWVLGRKVLELNSTEVASTIGTRGLNKVAR
ncbi:MAG: hypothetical protein FGM22_07410 [Burkholderiaceae bacterium]|nr:hypothetical protein [Burkholderiaceae bacterium]